MKSKEINWNPIKSKEIQWDLMSLWIFISSYIWSAVCLACVIVHLRACDFIWKSGASFDKPGINLRALGFIWDPRGFIWKPEAQFESPGIHFMKSNEIQWNVMKANEI